MKTRYWIAGALLGAMTVVSVPALAARGHDGDGRHTDRGDRVTARADHRVDRRDDAAVRKVHRTYRDRAPNYRGYPHKFNYRHDRGHHYGHDRWRYEHRGHDGHHHSHRHYRHGDHFFGLFGHGTWLGLRLD